MPLRQIVLSIVSTALLSALAPGGAAASGGCRGADKKVTRTGVGAAQRAVRCLLAQQRRSHGLRVLRTNARLGAAARRHGSDMVRRRYFSHVSPGGSDVVARVRATGYTRGRWQLGEALATGAGRAGTPRGLVRSLMHSPPHRAVLLDGAMRDLGTGVAWGEAPRANRGATLVLVLGRHG